MPVKPEPSKESDQAAVDVYQDTKTIELKKAAEQAKKKVVNLQESIADTRKLITDWTKWIAGIESRLRMGYNYDSDSNGTNDSYQFLYDPYAVTFTRPLTTNQLTGYKTRGESKLTTLKNILKEKEVRLAEAVKAHMNALQKYEAAAKKSGSPTGVNTNTIAGINAVSGTDYDETSTPGGGSGGTGGSADPDASNGTSAALKAEDAKRVKIKFNIPMVKSAYYSGETSSLQSQFVEHPNWTVKANGRKMWLNGSHGKGVIQPDLAVVAAGMSKTYKNSKAIVKDLNNELYGFRFLYNPNAITQSWGVSQEVDPVTISLGLDKGIPLTGNTTSSSISFELMLNRIEDMNHIDQVGWKRKEATGGSFDQVNNVGIYPTYYDDNPWPTNASPLTFNDDLKDIYNRGTLYDLDHLFSALMPAAPKYKSTLNGTLADRGYMSGYVCELHLGPGMRYKIQISSLNVEHIIFNERMVPLLSSVTITASRLPDVKKEQKKKWWE